MHLSFIASLTLLAFGLSATVAGRLQPAYTGNSDVQTRDNDGALQGVDGRNINPLNCTYSGRMFRQLVNHPTASFNISGQSNDRQQDSDNTETFLQQYKIIDDFFKPGGPIMFFQGAEHPLECFEIYSLFQYAIEVGALVVGIEHRFFGLSVPGNLSYENQLDWPASALSSLTLKNALMDSVELVKWVKSTVPGAQNSTVIAFGASYAGVLVTLLRVHFPAVFFGAFPSSPVYSGFVSNPQDPLVYAMGDWDSRVIQDASANASSKIQHAFQDLRQRIEGDELDTLKADLNLCTHVESKSSATNLIGAVAGTYNNLIQYDYSSKGLPFDTLVNRTLNENSADPLKFLRIAIELSNAQNNVSCLAWDPDGVRTFTTIPFQYIICTYLPYTAGLYSTADSIWGSMPPDFSSSRLNDAKCQKAFGFNSVESGIEYQRRLLLDQQSLEASTRMFISVGTKDPVTSIGPQIWWAQKIRECSRVYVISGGAHGEDMVPATPLDSTALGEVRVAQLNTIKEWLGINDLPEFYPDYRSYNDTAYFPRISEEIIKGIGG